MEEETKELILRDFLAIDRTRLANQRTLLSMVRTGLYFMVMGLSVLSLSYLKELQPFVPLFFVVGLAIIIWGWVGYRKMERKIKTMYR